VRCAVCGSAGFLVFFVLRRFAARFVVHFLQAAAGGILAAPQHY
jgi:hypothetical protein